MAVAGRLGGHVGRDLGHVPIIELRACSHVGNPILESRMQLTATAPKPAAAPSLNLGQSAVAGGLRAAASGYTASAGQAGVTVDKAAIVPFEGVITLTSELKKATAKVPVLGKATNLLNTAASFGLLIAAATVSGSLKAQANTTSSLLGLAADAIDGGKTAAPSGSIGDAIAAALAEAELRNAAAH